VCGGFQPGTVAPLFVIDRTDSRVVGIAVQLPDKSPVFFELRLPS